MRARESLGGGHGFWGIRLRWSGFHGKHFSLLSHLADLKAHFILELLPLWLLRSVSILFASLYTANTHKQVFLAFPSMPSPVSSCHHLAEFYFIF